MFPPPTLRPGGISLANSFLPLKTSQTTQPTFLELVHEMVDNLLEFFAVNREHILELFDLRQVILGHFGR